ncbi:MAG: hemDX [Panacagrimonas sp.]|jgi:uroporphyrinogen-III synthase|nr:uroporphyrinogen-III synthase [Panacagrimonas sp.]MCC2658849.1 hemDX [Panacagrimonas sp.]
MNVAGLRVLVTRPAAQSGPIEQRLRDAGMGALSLPLFEIETCGDDEAHRARLAEARGCDGWIFTSTNAAHRAIALAPQSGWPNLFAIGEATARVLAEAGHTGVQRPAGGNTSEDLLALPDLQDVSHRRLLVCTGAGGRDALAPELRHRGAVVDRIDLYRRIAVEHPETHVRDLAGRCDAVICTSGEGVARLHALLPSDMRARLERRVLVVPSQRVLELARQLGFTEVRTPLKTSDEALVDCLVHCDRASP